MSILHNLAHWLGWNRGVVVSAYERQHNLWMGFRCGSCGKVSSKGLSIFGHSPPPDEDFLE